MSHKATLSPVRLASAAALLTWASAATAVSSHLTAREMVNLSLEQLSDIVVSTVSKREEPLSRATASVYVISGDDIRRFGITSLPEALRLAPNLDVARINASQYAISARGFNISIANKLLVLIDGRTVYTPLFAGTFWDVQEVMLEDIQRIEVISGPGATLWGVNAVNGVINIITRAAAQTRGVLAASGTGTEQQDYALRYGGELDEDAHYRVYGKIVDRDRTVLPDGSENNDQAEHLQAGFRGDFKRGQNRFTLQGDAYEGEAPDLDRDVSGINLLGRWTRDLSTSSQLQVQAYFDRTFRHQSVSFEQQLDTVEFQAQHGMMLTEQQRLLWGFGVRQHRDNIENSAFVTFTPEQRVLKANYLFVQDELALRPDVSLTLGAKLESNTYTGNEFLPSARLGWSITPRHFVWTSLSRAVRSPSRVDVDLALTGGTADLRAGGPDFESEVARVVELGYRAQLTPALSYSLTAFYHDLEKLRTVTPAGSDVVLANEGSGHIHGLEGWGTWRPAPDWRLSAGFVRLTEDLDATADSDLSLEGNDPELWYKLRASWDINEHFAFDAMLRHYGSRPEPEVPAYTAVDARLGWQVNETVELSLLGQNLFDDSHPEWGTEATRAELERAAYVKLLVALE